MRVKELLQFCEKMRRAFALLKSSFLKNSKISQYGVITTGLSDHLITYCTRKSTKVVFNKHQGVKIRSLKNYSIKSRDKESFVNELCKIDWSEVVSCDGVDKAWFNFCTIFTNVRLRYSSQRDSD